MKMDRMNKIHGICLDLLSILFILVSAVTACTFSGGARPQPGDPGEVGSLVVSDRPAWRLWGLSIR